MITAYIDASWSPRSKYSGVAILCGDKYFGVPIAKFAGINNAELTAYKLALRLIPDRPLIICTDSEHVFRQFQKTNKGVESGSFSHMVILNKRCRNAEMSFVDALARFIRETGGTKSITGTIKDFSNPHHDFATISKAYAG